MKVFVIWPQCLHLQDKNPIGFIFIYLDKKNQILEWELHTQINHNFNIEIKQFANEFAISPVGLRVQNHVLGFGLHPGQLTSPRRAKGC